MEPMGHRVGHVTGCPMGSAARSTRSLMRNNVRRPVEKGRGLGWAVTWELLRGIPFPGGISHFPKGYPYVVYQQTFSPASPGDLRYAMGNRMEPSMGYPIGFTMWSITQPCPPIRRAMYMFPHMRFGGTGHGIRGTSHRMSHGISHGFRGRFHGIVHEE